MSIQSVRQTNLNLHDGTLTVTNTPTQLVGATPENITSVLVQNDPMSVNLLWVGNALSQSVCLRPGGDESIPVSDVSTIYVRSVAGGARVNWHAVGSPA